MQKISLKESKIHAAANSEERHSIASLQFVCVKIVQKNISTILSVRFNCEDPASGFDVIDPLFNKLARRLDLARFDNQKALDDSINKILKDVEIILIATQISSLE